MPFEAPGRPRRLRAAAHLCLMRFAARTGHVRKASLVLSRLVPATETHALVLPGGGVLRVRARDPYWARLLVGWQHEPDVHRVLSWAVAERPDAVLLDCGANIGLWSATFAARVRTVAVEATPPTYRELERTAAENGFTALHAAVWSASGETVDIGWSATMEAAAGVAWARRGEGEVAAVDTVSLSDLAAEYAAPEAPLIIKLDVEGAEVAALDGAVDVLDRALLVYEDHGSDPTHAVTAHVWSLGLRVFVTIEEGLRAVCGPADLDAIKTDRWYGYNFVAVSPLGLWAESLTVDHVAALPAPPATSHLSAE